MKKIISILLMTAVLLSAFIPAMSVSANSGNPTEFVADFTTTDNWTGDRTDLIQTSLGWFGANQDNGNTDYWNNPVGSITTVGSYDFGDSLFAKFNIYSYDSNGKKNNVNVDYSVTIGKFRIDICNLQTKIVLYYDGWEIMGETTEKSDITCPATTPTRDFNYTVKIEKGDIRIESDLILFTTNMRDFDPIDNAQISLAINETWQISGSFFKSFSASAYVPDETSFTADFTSTDGFEGMTGAINTDEGWFGAKEGFNGTTGPWSNAKGSITTAEKFDFGSVLDMNLALYTFYRNKNENGTNEDYYVTVGNFKIAICDFQTRIALYYDGVAVEGVSAAKSDITYPSSGKRDYTYDIHIESGNIIIESNLIKYTSTFDGFDTVNDASVGLTINEDWQIATGYIKSLTVAADSRTADAGDVNADGDINANDLVSVKRWLLNIDNALVWRFGDVNADSARDILDLIRLKKILAMVNNGTTFTADFATADGWTGDTSAINTTDNWYGSKSGFNGCTNGWDNPKTTITTTAKYNFGTALTADFALYTRYPNDSSNVVTDSFDVTIGDFTVRISAYQNQITLLYGGEKIASVWNEVYSYDRDAKNNYNYTVYISAGAIQIIQYNGTTELLVLDSDFADFTALDNVNISLTVNENWEINEAHFGSLNVTAIADNAEEFTADFSSKEYWSGELVDNINTVPLWFGTQKSGFGNNVDTSGNYVVWENPYGKITANEKVDLGKVFDGQFKIYTKDTNSSATDYNAYRFTIGKFEITVLGNQVGLVVKYNGTDIGGTLTETATVTGAKNFTYDVHIEPGNITVTSDVFTYTSDFTDYDAVVNAEISLWVLERWHIGSGRITHFNLTKADNDYNTVAVKEPLTGGTVTLDKSIAKAGETVTVTVSPDEGYNLAADGLYYQAVGSTEKVAILTSSDGVQFTFEMPDSDVAITALFNENTETDISVSAVSYSANNDDTAAADGITVTTRVASLTAKDGTVLYGGNTYAVSEYGIIVDGGSGEETISSNSVINQNDYFVDFAVSFKTDSWSKEYSVTPYVKLNNGEFTVKGDEKSISLNLVTGLAKENGVTASYIANSGDKTYIVHNGTPYMSNGVQAQINRKLIAHEPDTDYEFDTFIRPMFETAAELCYDTLVLMIPWRCFEPDFDQYNFDIIRKTYDYADELDLNIQLIWGGSDICGSHKMWVPQYINDDTVTYSLFGDTDALDYSDKDLVYREKKAFSKLLSALYKYDTSRRTVAIQIENEPNTGIDGTPDHTSLEDVNKNTWVGQESAVKSLINELAILAHTGAYRCVTRVNYVAYTCYFNGVDNNDPLELIRDTAVDIVGFSAYGDLTADNKIISAISGQDNIPHLAESHGATSLAPVKMLNAASKAGGLMHYELCYVEGYSSEYTVLKSDGSYRDGSENDNITTELISVNKMLGAMSEIMAVLPYENMAVLNLEQALNCTEDISVCGLGILYSHNTEAPYGGAGMVVCDIDGTYYLYQTRDSATFAISDKTVTGLSVGTFENGVWVEKRAVDTAQTITLTAEDALNGYVCRVTVD